MERVGRDISATLCYRTLSLYGQAADYAATRGVIIADTKFEFGQLPDGRLILIDEVLTPDSSRFWPADEYSPGRDQPSFDKQFVRNYLESQPWDKTPPAPVLPQEVVEGTPARSGGVRKTDWAAIAAIATARVIAIAPIRALGVP